MTNKNNTIDLDNIFSKLNVPCFIQISLIKLIYPEVQSRLVAFNVADFITVQMYLEGINYAR